MKINSSDRENFSSALLNGAGNVSINDGDGDGDLVEVCLELEALVLPVAKFRLV